MAKSGKYRSRFENRCGDLLEPEGFEYEPFRIPYEVKHRYTPDFVFTKGDEHPEILVEAKGYFRPGDTQKYKAIKKCLNSNQELLFLLQSPTKQVRSGAKLTMAGWCNKEGIRWFCNTSDVIRYVNS
jgi:hypothetical protein